MTQQILALDLLAESQNTVAQAEEQAIATTRRNTASTRNNQRRVRSATRVAGIYDRQINQIIESEQSAIATKRQLSTQYTGLRTNLESINFNLASEALRRDEVTGAIIRQRLALGQLNTQLRASSLIPTNLSSQSAQLARDTAIRERFRLIEQTRQVRNVRDALQSNLAPIRIGDRLSILQQADRLRREQSIQRATELASIGPSQAQNLTDQIRRRNLSNALRANLSPIDFNAPIFRGQISQVPVNNAERPPGTWLI